MKAAGWFRAHCWVIIWAQGLGFWAQGFAQGAQGSQPIPCSSVVEEFLEDRCRRSLCRIRSRSPALQESEMHAAVEPQDSQWTIEPLPPLSSFELAAASCCDVQSMWPQDVGLQQSNAAQNTQDSQWKYEPLPPLSSFQLAAASCCEVQSMWPQDVGLQQSDAAPKASRPHQTASAPASSSKAVRQQQASNNDLPIRVSTVDAWLGEPFDAWNSAQEFHELNRELNWTSVPAANGPPRGVSWSVVSRVKYPKVSGMLEQCVEKIKRPFRG